MLFGEHQTGMGGRRIDGWKGELMDGLHLIASRACIGMFVSFSSVTFAALGTEILVPFTSA
jgi:hypothetical protein